MYLENSDGTAISCDLFHSLIIGDLAIKNIHKTNISQVANQGDHH